MANLVWTPPIWWSAMFPELERSLFAGGLLLVYFIFFWGHTALLHTFDCLGCFRRFKIQQGKAPPNALVREALLHVVLGNLVSVPAAAYFGYDFFTKQGMRFGGGNELPTWFEAISTLFVWHVLFDTWFYWSHRLMHHPAIYSKIHKQHHKFMTPVGICATYAHPVEDVLVNLGSTLVGPCLFRSDTHFVILCSYFALRFNETIDAHSGYDFPWSIWQYTGRGTAEWHDWHHSNQVGNFGGWPFWDRLCGTDRLTIERKSNKKAKRI